ncbi:MAG TPA: hypothetical protein VK716_08385 [Terracidiphilus sp.]|jgi:hypothetical protein|nr:hypothetical protein [Terracidiphilus sp.]
MALNFPRRMTGFGASALLIAGLAAGLGLTNVAAESKKTSAPAPKAAPAAKPASRPAGGTGGAAHGATTGGTTSHGPTANGGGTSHGPTANGAHTTTSTGAHPTTAGGAGARGTTAGGAHTTGPARTATGHIAPAGSHTVSTRNGAVTRRPDGRISDVHDARRGMDVHHGLNGGRRVSVERADHSRIVAERGRRGYIERRYGWHGHDYARRSYYWHGHEYNRYYRGYYYHGAYVNVYAPGYYYAPAFYGWAYNPWAVPVAYGAWGWAGNPWYGYYGFYFNPYPVYAGPAFWLTDYLIAAQLQAAYAAGAASAGAAAALGPDPNNGTPVLVASLAPIAAPASGGAPALTPAIKQMISDEVKGQIALENAEAQQNSQGQDADPASSGIERLMSDGKSHVFVAGDSLDVTDANGAECALSDGDVLQLSGPPAADATDATLTVLASKGTKECSVSSTVTVAVTDLQEMQNHMRETIDQGMQELQSKQGQGGLPAAPASAKAAPTETGFSKDAPPAEQNGEADVNAQLTEADKAEQEAAASAPAGGADSETPAAAAAAPAPTATVDIALGQTIDQVTSSMGQPIAIVNLGTKKIYKYKDMKITFKDGKVSDVE